MRVIHALREFVAFKSAGGILLAIAAVAALTLATRRWLSCIRRTQQEMTLKQSRR
ncbi:MAG: hypothetical protein Q7R41_06455 [Phycisphaerales bacterium]|nr:hypothetical protein [Phycisphaerales bacterium]